MPPEWAPHDGTWFSWPHNRETWPASLAGAQTALTDAVIALAEDEVVHINVLDAEHRAAVANRFTGRVPPGNVLMHMIATDDAWCRDHGAIFVIDERGERVALNFRFNAWGGKYPFERDNAVPAQMAAVVGASVTSVDVVLEGGSIDVNGAGVVLTTEQCLLNPNRNPTLGRADIEAALRRYLGVTQVLWLGDGIVGDDTDGHIDDLARFVNPHTIVTVVEDDPADTNYRVLADNLARLRSLRDEHGRAFTIETLPMPPALHHDGTRLPASYANFYIVNGGVIVPTFDCAADTIALATLERLLPGRRVVGLPATDLVWGLGAVHCLTQQHPLFTV
jgi:agmatine deiminase